MWTWGWNVIGHSPSIISSLHPAKYSPNSWKCSCPARFIEDTLGDEVCGLCSLCYGEHFRQSWKNTSFLHTGTKHCSIAAELIQNKLKLKAFWLDVCYSCSASQCPAVQCSAVLGLIVGITSEFVMYKVLYLWLQDLCHTYSSAEYAPKASTELDFYF